MKIKVYLLVVLFLCLCFPFNPYFFLSAQSDKKEDPLCGPKSLLAVLKTLGVRAELEEVKALSDYKEGRGATMAGLYKAVQAKGLDAAGMKITLDDLSKVKIPAIVFLWGGHFEAIDKFEKDRIRIIGPDAESKWMSKKEFANTYSGLALLISKKKSSFPKIDTKGSDIRFDEYVYTFGVIEQFSQKKIEHIFKFKNVGNSNLLIERAYSSCGCTATMISDRDIPPGGEGEVKAIVDVEGRQDEQTFAVFIRSNDPITPIIELQVKGIIKRKLKINPDKINFSSVKKGSIATRKLYILVPEGEELNILKTESSSDYLSTKHLSFKEKANQGIEIEIMLASDAPMGKLEETLTIHTDNKKLPKIEIPVTGNIKSDIELRPNMFFFGIVNKGETSTSKVNIFTTGKEPLKIEKIENPIEFISIVIIPNIENKEYEITATLKNNIPVGSLKGNITIYTNSIDQPKIQIPVSALVQE